MRRVLGLCAAFLLSSVGLEAQTLPSSQGALTVDTMADGFDTPWALGFLPDGSFLVTERKGRLWRVDPAGRKTRIRGLPSIHVQNQGGLLDILVPRDFAKNRTIFFTYVKKQPSGAGTAVGRARLAQGSSVLSNVTKIFEMSQGSSGGRHFGSRIVEAPDGTLFVTIGERGDRPSAQNLDRHNGSILRIHKDGSVPDDNPFVSHNTAYPEIWSYGHRNPQGAALDRAGTLWATEHGAKGGDEVNRIQKGANYGWPVVAFGRHYSGAKIGEGTAKPGMRAPEYYWDPSIAPSGLMIYSGKLWPNWAGHMFVGSLKFDYISRLSGAKLIEKERLKSAQTGRVRDIREAADGRIWFISEDSGAVMRLSP